MPEKWPGIEFRNPMGGLRWRLTPDGLEVEGKGYVRTRGAPVTMRNIWLDFGGHLKEAAGMMGYGADVLAVLVALESVHDKSRPGHRNVRSVRTEKGYVDDKSTPRRISVGLMQTMLAYARGAAGLTPWARSRFDREYLCDPRVSIVVGAAMVRQRHNKHRGDPILISAAHNAGGVYKTTKNDWRIRTHGTHRLMDTAKWYNDFVHVLREEQVIDVPYRRLLMLPETASST